MANYLDKDTIENTGTYVDTVIHRGSSVINYDRLEKIDDSISNTMQVLRDVFPSFDYSINEDGDLTFEKDDYSSHKFTTVNVISKTTPNYAELYDAVRTRDVAFSALYTLKAVTQNVRTKTEYRIYQKLKLQFEGKQTV